MSINTQTGEPNDDLAQGEQTDTTQADTALTGESATQGNQPQNNPPAEEPKAEESKAEESKAEEPKAEEPKAEKPDQAILDTKAGQAATAQFVPKTQATREYRTQDQIVNSGQPVGRRNSIEDETPVPDAQGTHSAPHTTGGGLPPSPTAAALEKVGSEAAAALGLDKHPELHAALKVAVDHSMMNDPQAADGRVMGIPNFALYGIIKALVERLPKTAQADKDAIHGFICDLIAHGRGHRPPVGTASL